MRLDSVREAIRNEVQPDAVLEALLSAVNQFARGAPQADDITVLVCRYTGQQVG